MVFRKNPGTLRYLILLEAFCHVGRTAKEFQMNSSFISSSESLHNNASVKNSSWGTNTKTIAHDGISEWQIAFQFHEVGGDRQRDTIKSFGSAEEARAFFDGQVVKFTNIFGRSTNASIKQSEAELLIDLDGIRVVKMTYQEIALRCA